jgi:hypothetical protein
MQSLGADIRRGEGGGLFEKVNRGLRERRRSLFFIDRNNENANLRVCAVGYGGREDLPAEASAKAGAV